MNSNALFTGVATALVTPFCDDDDRSIDYTSLGKLIERQIGLQADALVICGTTGESSTLEPGEKAELFRFSVEVCAHRIPVIAGTGSNSTHHAAELTHIAADAGVDGILAVTPYYNKASPDGFLAHYRAIADAAPQLPVIVYTVPSRTGMGIPPAVCGQLFDIPNIVGVKDATGDISHTARLAALYGDSIAIYSGNDETALPVLSLGGCGVISVVSNIVPSQMHEICRLYFGGKTYEAAGLAAGLYPLIRALFCEVNPIPVKTALWRMGLCNNAFRLPLSQAAPETLRIINAALGSFPGGDFGNISTEKIP